MQAIHQALERHGGNKPKAAEELGISLKTLYNKLNQSNAAGQVGVNANSELTNQRISASATEPSLHLPHHAHHHAQHLGVLHVDRLHVRVGRLQADAILFQIERLSVASPSSVRATTIWPSRAVALLADRPRNRRRRSGLRSSSRRSP